jgi:hypothetical protein
MLFSLAAATADQTADRRPRILFPTIVNQLLLASIQLVIVIIIKWLSFAWLENGGPKVIPQHY